nr:hypothetical protein [Tanacetum cinerariifolium]
YLENSPDKAADASFGPISTPLFQSFDRRTGTQVDPSVIPLLNVVSTSTAPHSVSPPIIDVSKHGGPDHTAEGAGGQEGPQALEHVDILAQRALAHDHINLSSSDDAFFPTMGNEIEKKLFTLFPNLTTSLIHMLRAQVVNLRAMISYGVTPAGQLRHNSSKLDILRSLLNYAFSYPFYCQTSKQLSLELTNLKEEHEKLQEECHDRCNKNKKLKSNESMSSQVKKLRGQLAKAKGAFAQTSSELSC